jgi:hypothetical protein
MQACIAVPCALVHVGSAIAALDLIESPGGTADAKPRTTDHLPYPTNVRVRGWPLVSTQGGPRDRPLREATEHGPIETEIGEHDVDASQCPKRRFAHLKGKDHGAVLSAADVSAKGWDSFLTLAQGIAGRAALRYTAPRTTSVVVSDSGNPNAFAYEDAGFGSCKPLIVLTSGFIGELQSFAGQCYFFLQAELDEGSADNVLRSTWGELPRADNHFEAFAELIGHVTLALLTYHELAHISLGHLDYYTPSNASATASDEPRVVNEAASAASLHQRDGAADRFIQAMEMDADIHALQWTRHYLRELGERHAQSPVTLEMATNDVWAAFLTAHLGRRYLLVCGFSLLFLLLGARDFELHSLPRRSHPPAALRLAALVQVEANLSGPHTEGDVIPRMGDAVRLAFGCWASRMQRQELERETDGATHETEKTVWKVDYGMEISGLKTVLDEWELIGAHLQRLAAYRREAGPTLDAKSLVAEEARVDWYSVGTID